MPSSNRAQPDYRVILKRAFRALAIFALILAVSFASALLLREIAWRQFGIDLLQLLPVGLTVASTP